MRYELTDFECAAIRSLLPNKPRGIARVDDRRVATRYDKPAANYPAFIKLESIRIWLRANESAP
jgi:transposase